MHLAYVLSRFPLLSETFILRELVELERRGHELDIVPLVVERPATVHSEAASLSRRVVDLGLSSRSTFAAILETVRRHPLDAARVCLEAWWANRASPRFLARALIVAPKALAASSVLTRRGVTHLHAHYGTHSALLAWMIHRLTGLPYSVTVHAHDLLVDRTMLDRKLRDAVFVVAISEHHRDLVRRTLGDDIAAKTRVVRCGIELDRYHSASTSRAPLAALEIVSIGTLQPYKGFRFLIEALARLRDRGQRFRCRIVGGGREEADLRSRIEAAGLADSVVLLGPRTQDEVAALLETAHCYVQASIVLPTGKTEGLPVALMEALACELPVVATEVGAVSELVRPGETGTLVPPADPEALANAIEAVARDWDSAKAMAAAGRELVRSEHDIRRSVDQLEALFAPAAEVEKAPRRLSPRHVVLGDWPAAVFATALYVQVPTMLEARYPTVPTDALIGASALGVVAARWWFGARSPRNALVFGLLVLPWLLAGAWSGIDSRQLSAWRMELDRTWQWALLAMLLIALLDTRKALHRTLYALLAAGAVVGALNCHQFLTSSWDRTYLGLAGVSHQHLYGTVDGYRAIGPAADPNYHALFLLPLLAIASERMWNASAVRHRALAAVAALLVAPAFLLTYSRGAMIAVAVLLPAAAVAAVRWRVPMRRLALTLAIVVCSIAVAGPTLGARLGTFELESPRQALDDRGLRGRISENLVAIEMLAEHPWNGIGLGAFDRAYGEYASRLGIDPRPYRSAHNFYLEVASETGVLGVVGLTVLLGSLFAVVERTRRALLLRGEVDAARCAAGVAMALLAYFITTAFLHLTYRSLFWVLIALGFGLPGAYGLSIAGALLATRGRGSSPRLSF